LEALPGTFTAEANPEIGCVELNFNLTDAINDNIIIRRACSRDNYLIWEDIHLEKILKTAGSIYTWKDYTIECGVYYKYGI